MKYKLDKDVHFKKEVNMIFSNRETAGKVRKEAEAQLTEWIADMLITLKKVAKKPIVDLSDVSLQRYAENQIRHMPPLVATLLYKSGIIGTDQDGVNPVILNYDNDNENDYKLTNTFLQVPGGLIGGLVNGHIHT